MSQAVRFAREIDAALEAVFDAFTQQDGQEAFYGNDDPGWIVESDCDLRVGGLWTVTFETEFTFEERDGKTLMTMIQRGLPSAELREEHRRGVPNALARFERLIQLGGDSD